MPAGGRYRLTPLYDVVSVWPIIGDGANNRSWHKAKLAMAVSGTNRHYHLKDIQRRHFNAMAAKCGHGENAESLIQKLIERVPGAIEEVKAKLPPAFPEQVAGAIFQQLQASATRLQDMPAS